MRTEQKRVETLGFFHHAVHLYELVERSLLHETVRVQDGFDFFAERFYVLWHGAEVVDQLGWSGGTGVDCCERNLEGMIPVSLPST